MRREIVFLLAAIAVSLAANAFSTLEPVAINQKGRPLENVSFFIQCVQEDRPNPLLKIEGKTFLCKSDHTGRCFPDYCIGCSENSEVEISAKYFDQEKVQTVANWDGYRYDVLDCKTKRHEQYYTPPVNELDPFEFATYPLRIEAKNKEGIPIENAKIIANSPATFYRECKTNTNGVCEIEDMPEDSVFYISAEFAGERNETNINMSGAKTILFYFLGTLDRVEFEFRIFDRWGEPTGDTDVSVYLLDQKEYLVRKKVDRDAVIEIPKNANVTVTVSYDGAVAYKEDLIATENRLFNVTINFTHCDDGTPHLSCAGNYLCRWGRKAYNCQTCSCAEGNYCSKDPEEVSWQCCPLGTAWNGTACARKEDMFRIYFVPINYDPQDEAFQRDVASFAQFINREYELPYTSFILVDKPLLMADMLGSLCSSDAIRLNLIEGHFKRWYREKLGSGKDPNEKLYRVIGIDRIRSCIDDSSCGYTYLEDTVIYVNGAENLSFLSLNLGEKRATCGQMHHVAAHELGHTFGLCDDYNPYIWEFQNHEIEEKHGFSCPNEKPTTANTPFFGNSIDRCAYYDPVENKTKYPVCTYGVRIEPIENIYSIMGSADIVDQNNMLIKREFARPIKEYILRILREMESGYK